MITFGSVGIGSSEKTEEQIELLNHYFVSQMHSLNGKTIVIKQWNSGWKTFRTTNKRTTKARTQFNFNWTITANRMKSIRYSSMSTVEGIYQMTNEFWYRVNIYIQCREQVVCVQLSFPHRGVDAQWPCQS